MSYILDALRRADAERHRGQAPALLQVTGQTPLPSSHGRSPSLRRLAPWLLAAVLGAAALTAWLISRPPAPVPPPLEGPAGSTAPLPVQAPASAAVMAPAPARSEAAALPPPAPTAAAPAPGAAPVTMPTYPASARLPVPAATARALPPAPVPAAAPLPVSATAPEPAQAPAPLPAPLPTPLPTPLPAPTPSLAVAPPPTPGSAAAPRAIHASALAEPQRAAIHRLGIGGAVHSPERGQSFVLVGGQIMREGATLAPGITLERISPHLLLLRLGEQRVEWPL